MLKMRALIVIVFSIVIGCAPKAPTPDPVSAGVTVALAVEGTLTALAPTVTPPPPPSATPVATNTPRPTSKPYPTRVRPSATPRPSPAAPHASKIYVQVQKYSYQQWGRPRGMDDPSGPWCQEFDDSRPVTMLAASLHIENRSSQAMNNWWGFFFDPSGNRLLACYYQGGTIQPIPPGGAAEITFAIYMEQPYMDVHGYIADQYVGRSDDLFFSHLH